MKPAPVIFTFHKIREQSEQGNGAAWRALLDFYGAALFRLLEIHAAMSTPEAFLIVQQTMARLSGNKFEKLRATSRQSEREFLGDLRGLLLEAALGSAAFKETSTHGNPFTSEKITKVLDGLPLLHKEMLLFKLGGYTEQTIERIMRLSPRVAEKAFERLSGEYQPVRQLQQDRNPWPAAWLAFVTQVQVLKTEHCTPAHEMVRIHDGQVSWYEKEPVEKHVSECLRCLEAWTGLREVGYWRRAADPLSSSEIERLMGVIPVEKTPAKNRSFFARLRR
ncbi:MAG TPA: hypothetical protein VFB23_07775 [Candidatus Acidoferrales bacterium]|nr:hypothetical protein [Candidatus Acidoferrales bacterium]